MRNVLISSPRQVVGATYVSPVPVLRKGSSVDFFPSHGFGSLLAQSELGLGDRASIVVLLGSLVGELILNDGALRIGTILGVLLVSGVILLILSGNVLDILSPGVSGGSPCAI